MRSLVPPDPPLRGGEILLRPSRPSDVRAIREVYSERDIRRWMGWGDELPERASRSWPDGSRFDSIVYSLLRTD